LWHLNVNYKKFYVEGFPLPKHAHVSSSIRFVIVQLTGIKQYI